MAAKNIPVKPDTFEEVYDLKRSSDTWDDVVSRLLKDASLDDQGTEKEDHNAQ